MVLVRSVRTTGAVPSVTAAAAAGCWDRHGGPLSTSPAATPAATTGAAMAAARRRRRRRPCWPGARSAVIAQAHQCRGADLGVQERVAGLRGLLEGGAGLPAGRDLTGRQAEPVARRVGGLGGGILDVRQAVGAHALGRAHPGL